MTSFKKVYKTSETTWESVSQTWDMHSAFRMTKRGDRHHRHIDGIVFLNKRNCSAAKVSMNRNNFFFGTLLEEKVAQERKLA